MHGIEEFEVLNKHNRHKWSYHIGGRLPGGPGWWDKLRGMIKALLLRRIKKSETMKMPDKFDD